MKTKILSIATIVLLAITISSCAKKQGCTDVDAINYDAVAEETDNSCTYSRDVTFWMDQATTDNFDADGITALTYYLDGNVVGSSGTNVYFASEPSCGANGTLSITKSLGTEKTKTFALVVKDQDDYEVYTYSLTLAGASSGCFKVKVNY